LTQALDDLEGITRLDSLNILETVEGFADQCRRGWQLGISAAALPDPGGIESVVVLGMGGSGVSGDVVRAVVEPRLPFPFRVEKGYGPLPSWVGRSTLVVAVSYSGDTEETLAAASDALERGARMVTIATGGGLATMADEHGLSHVAVPPGLQPRSALGLLTLPLLAVLDRMELVPPFQEDVEEATDVLDALGARCNRKITTADNPAKSIAEGLVNTIPLVYGGRGVGSTAAYRFKCDLNEYAKTPAFWNELPELNHNEIESWDATEMTKDFALVLLRDPSEHPSISRRFEVSRELIGGRAENAVEVMAEGQSPLAHLLSLLFVTQLAAIYLAIARGVDPGPVEVLQRLKQKLAES
jgi:glucose/mannose-6-phosphate isomerase